MAPHTAELLNPSEDDFADPPRLHRRPGLRPRRHRLTVEALAWAALVVLTFGPVIGYVLATLL